MVRILFGIAAGIATGVAISFGLGVMFIKLANDDSLADFGD